MHCTPRGISPRPSGTLCSSSSQQTKCLPPHGSSCKLRSTINGIPSNVICSTLSALGHSDDNFNVSLIRFATAPLRAAIIHQYHLLLIDSYMSATTIHVLRQLQMLSNSACHLHHSQLSISIHQLQPRNTRTSLLHPTSVAASLSLPSAFTIVSLSLVYNHDPFNSLVGSRLFKKNRGRCRGHDLALYHFTLTYY